MNIHTAFEQINKLQIESDAILEKQMELYDSIILDDFDKQEVRNVLNDAEDSVARLYLADYYRQRFK